MRSPKRFFSAVGRLLLGSMLPLAIASTFAQVSPKEISNARSRADEQKYLPQLQSLQQMIATAKFPYSFKLARYLNAKPGQREAMDSNGIEFVYFRQRVVLKISGLYKAAFDPTRLSQNERAGRTLREAVLPILRLVAQQIPQGVDCDGIGFEIKYDMRDADAVYDYEGREALTVVFNREDAFALANATSDAERQEIIGRSDIFVNGKDIALSLGQRDPLNMLSPEQSSSRRGAEEVSPSPARAARAGIISGATVSPAVSVVRSILDSDSSPTFADAMRLQAEFKAQTDAIIKRDWTKFHLNESAAPSIEVSGNQMLLHLTMRNTMSFEGSSTSIYKRAAQSFDLFLAPELRDLSKMLPKGTEIDVLDFSVLNHIGYGGTPVETIDYICPLESLRSFAENKITSQDLINQSTVLVNGVRIGLNLQLVE